MKVEKIGYGAGEKDFTGHPNIARLFIGERIEAVTGAPGLPGDEVVSVIEANVDDMSPQLYGYFLEQALAAGALDVTCSSAQMKKNRPGLTISILCEPGKSEALSQLLFEQTTTIGVRILRGAAQGAGARAGDGGNPVRCGAGEGGPPRGQGG